MTAQDDHCRYISQQSSVCKVILDSLWAIRLDDIMKNYWSDEIIQIFFTNQSLMTACAVVVAVVLICGAVDGSLYQVACLPTGTLLQPPFSIGLSQTCDIGGSHDMRNQRSEANSDARNIMARVFLGSIQCT
jgi:hypothetical protein